MVLLLTLSVLVGLFFHQVKEGSCRPFPPKSVPRLEPDLPDLTSTLHLIPFEGVVSQDMQKYYTMKKDQRKGKMLMNERDYKEGPSQQFIDHQTYSLTETEQPSRLHNTFLEWEELGYERPPLTDEERRGYQAAFHDRRITVPKVLRRKGQESSHVNPTSTWDHPLTYKQWMELEQGDILLSDEQREKYREHYRNRLVPIPPILQFRKNWPKTYELWVQTKNPGDIINKEERRRYKLMFQKQYGINHPLPPLLQRATTTFTPDTQAERTAASMKKRASRTLFRKLHGDDVPFPPELLTWKESRSLEAAAKREKGEGSQRAAVKEFINQQERQDVVYVVEHDEAATAPPLPNLPDLNQLSGEAEWYALWNNHHPSVETDANFSYGYSELLAMQRLQRVNIASIDSVNIIQSYVTALSISYERPLLEVSV